MKIKLDKKFAEKDLDAFINSVYQNIKRFKNDTYIFDFTEVEWISNQEMLVITALLKYFIASNIRFEVLFFKKGIPIFEIPERVAKQLIQIWDVWKIGQIIPNNEYFKYFGIDGTSIRALKELHNYNTIQNEIYNRLGITPFISLENINNYNDNDIENILKPIYKLNTALKEIVQYHNLEHPFITDTLSSIVTKELYENFLDHFDNTIFHSKENWAFTSLSLKSNIKGSRPDKNTVQKILKVNFQEEALNESESFFYDFENREFKNESYLQFSFLDFGKGIIETLKEQYQATFDISDTSSIDENEILKYAFQHNSSRHPIDLRINKNEVYIPRGLFDLLSIVKRYEGLLIARSNSGKILYDFSRNKSIEDAYSVFGNKALYFPGTLISLYLPAIPSNKKIDISAIKPILYKPNYQCTHKAYINLYHVINKIRSRKQDLYTSLLKALRKETKNDKGGKITYFSFRGYENDKRLSKKTLYFLLIDYEINIDNNIIVFYPPSLNIVKEIQEELLNLSSIIKNYKVHPLPLVYFNPIDETINLQWLGIYDNDDKNKLNYLLFEQYSLSKSDFNEPDNIVGQINYFDLYGNLNSQLPQKEQLIKTYKEEHRLVDNKAVQGLLIKNNCIKKSTNEDFYLCNGNYYQYQFIELINLLNNQDDCNLISEILFRRIEETFQKDYKYKYIGVTSSSHKLIFSLIEQGFISEDEVILLDNYLVFDRDEKLKIEPGFKYILLCDVIATGNLTSRLQKKIEQSGSELTHVAVLVNTIDEEFENSEVFLKDNASRLISLYTYPIKKYRRENTKIKEDIKVKKVIRINPFTNLPITLSIEDTNYKSIIISNIEFLKTISEEHIKVGYLKYNNLIHPYFFDTKQIIKNISINFLKNIFEKISITTEDLKIFYPKESGLKFLDFNILRNVIFKDHSIETYELDRFNTVEGWKFPHTADHFGKVTEGKSVLILDDGSCTGDSLIQMIDEIAFTSVKEVF